LVFGRLEELEKFLTALRSSVLVPSAVVVTSSITEPGDRDPASSRFRVLISFEGHNQAVERQNKDLQNLAREFGGNGAAKTGRDTMVKSLRATLDPDILTRDSLALKVSVPIAQGPRTYVDIQKLSKEFGQEAKVALFAGNGVISLYLKRTNREGLSHFIAGIKEIGQAAGGYSMPIWGHRNLVSDWGPRVEPALHRYVLQPLKDKLDPTGVFPPII
jgi:hypothetical protein